MKKAMLNKENCFSSGKRFIFLAIFFTTVITASYSQISWTTVQDNNYRVIPLSQVKAEILRISDLYQWFYEPQILTREQYKQLFEIFGLGGDPIVRRDSERSLRWINNHQRFAFAQYLSEINSVSIFIVNGNSVGFLTIQNNNAAGIGISTRNKQRLGQIIDSLLTDISFPSSFQGTWKRNNYNNTLTFTQNTLKSSSQNYTWRLTNISGDLFSLTVNSTAQITIKLVGNNLVISGDTGDGQDNWNGTWRKQ